MYEKNCIHTLLSKQKKIIFNVSMMKMAVSIIMNIQVLEYMLTNMRYMTMICLYTKMVL